MSCVCHGICFCRKKLNGYVLYCIATLYIRFHLPPMSLNSVPFFNILGLLFSCAFQNNVFCVFRVLGWLGLNMIRWLGSSWEGTIDIHMYYTHAQKKTIIVSFLHLFEALCFALFLNDVTRALVNSKDNDSVFFE